MACCCTLLQGHQCSDTLMRDFFTVTFAGEPDKKTIENVFFEFLG